MLQVVHGASRRRTEFDFDDVADGICRKLILRHPHIFGDVQADDRTGPH
ncbi:MAG: MazG nucleotide pyrophosphohydrolase domain-containing protein [Eubacteriales bacterium]